MTEPKSSNQPEPAPEGLRATPRCGCARGCNAPFQDVIECALHGPDIPPMPSTVHNVHNQRRVIE